MFQQSTTVLEQVKSNLINLMLTRKGERLHQPEFGCDVHQHVFNPITDTTLEDIKLTITSAIDRWMPFIAVESVDINQFTDSTLQVFIDYKFRSNPNVLDSITLTF